MRDVYAGWRESRAGLNDVQSLYESEATRRFYNLESVADLFELYKRGGDLSRRFIAREIAGVCDEICEGRPEQILLYRLMMHAVRQDLAGADGKQPLPEEFPVIARKMGLRTLRVDGVSTAMFLELLEASVLPQIQRSLSSLSSNPTGGESWIGVALKSKQPLRDELAIMRRTLEESGFRSDECASVMRWSASRLHLESEGGSEALDKLEAEVDKTIERAVPGADPAKTRKLRALMLE